MSHLCFCPVSDCLCFCLPCFCILSDHSKLPAVCEVVGRNWRGGGGEGGCDVMDL